MAKLNKEEIIELKEYISKVRKRVWIGTYGLTPNEVDLFDTIESQQQEIDMMQTFKGKKEPEERIINLLQTDRDELIKWIGRAAWHCKKVDELGREIEQIKVQMVQAARGNAGIVDLAGENVKLQKELNDGELKLDAMIRTYNTEHDSTTKEIVQLQAQNAAAIEDIKHALAVNGGCPICKHWNKAEPQLPWCKIAKVSAQTNCFEWRGVSTTYHNPADVAEIEQLNCNNKVLSDSCHILRQENERYQQWVNDLQSGMYINCVYCGHRYGPEKDTPVSMADVLKEHIEQCPKHPMSKLKQEIVQLKEAFKKFYKETDRENQKNVVRIKICKH